ncbi:MAG: GDP-mannose 4,6-dehydratase [Propionibacteriaceae bacterium]|nr:GDP-mannose 4,6-dehydratase [Propionibacteriaceae bacterium]
MRAVVFGSSGQDGSLLSLSLLKQGYELVGVSRSYASVSPTHQALGIAESINYVTADLCDFRSVLQIFKQYQPDEVYNLAAQSSVGESFKQPSNTFNSIINGTVNLLEVARFCESPARLFFAGSSESYGNSSLPATVQTPRLPTSPYAIAKDAAFHVVKLYREAYHLNCVTGVLFNHESPYRASSFVTRKIINGALRCASDSGFFLQLGNLDVSRDWGWASEYVEAMQLLLRAKHLSDQLICTGRMVSLRYFVEQAFSRVGLNWQEHVELQPALLRPSEILQSVGDPEPMAVHTGWRATKDVDAVIDALLEAARA